MTRFITGAGYVLFVGVAIGLELTARRTRRLLTFAEMLEVSVRRRWVRLLLQAGWLWVGWHGFVRVDWR